MRPANTAYSRDEFDLQHFRTIPIEEVAEAFGVEVNGKNRFICPSHNDTNPSAVMKPRGRNAWHCYACGADGSPIDLVMAVEGISFQQAIYRLEELFPGGIIKRQPDKEENDEFLPPRLETELCNMIGLSKNPYFNIRVSMVKKEDEYGKQKETEQKDLCLSYKEATVLVIDKMIEYINNQRLYEARILKDFPEIDATSATHIHEVINERIRKMQGNIEIFRNYLNQLDDRLDTRSPWDEQEREAE